MISQEHKMNSVSTFQCRGYQDVPPGFDIEIDDSELPLKIASLVLTANHQRKSAVLKLTLYNSSEKLVVGYQLGVKMVLPGSEDKPASATQIQSLLPPMMKAEIAPLSYSPCELDLTSLTAGEPVEGSKLRLSVIRVEFMDEKSANGSEPRYKPYWGWIALAGCSAPVIAIFRGPLEMGWPSSLFAGIATGFLLLFVFFLVFRALTKP